MEVKIILMTFFTITTLVSFAYPNLAPKNDNEDEPLIHSDGEMDAMKEISPASQEYNLEMLNNLPPKYLIYLGSCMKKTGHGPNIFHKCSYDVLEEILMKKPVSRDCCLRIAKAGEGCYIEITKTIFKFYQLKRFASQFSKTHNVWNRCSSVVEIP